MRGGPPHEDEEEEEEEDRFKLPPIPIVEKKAVAPTDIVAVAEAFVREVQTREVVPRHPSAYPGYEEHEPQRVPGPQVPAAVPAWVPVAQELVVPEMYPVPAPVAPWVGAGGFVGDPSHGSTPMIAPDPTEPVMRKIAAVGVGVGIAVAAAPTVFWVSRIVTISRILIGLRGSGLAPQTGRIALPTARALIGAAGMTVVRGMVTGANRVPDSHESDELAKSMVEELVVDYMYETAADFYASLQEPYRPDYAGVPDQPSEKPGGTGYLYDFGAYLNSQISPNEGPIPGASPPPTTY